MNVLEDVRTNDGMEISFHVLKEKVNVLIIISFHYVEESDDVIVSSEFLKKDNLSKSPLRIGGILKGAENLLQREDLSTLFILDFPYDSVCSLTELLENLVLVENVLLDLFVRTNLLG